MILHEIEVLIDRIKILLHRISLLTLKMGALLRLNPIKCLIVRRINLTHLKMIKLMHRLTKLLWILRVEWNLIIWLIR
jgi:hypothetical protein